MPNWCNNVIRLSHPDPAMIDRVVNAADSGILQELVPCPKELQDPETTTWSHGPEQEARDKMIAALKEKYGYGSWYDWNIANWGTKWDLCEARIDRHDANNITICCETAWAPPVEAYGTMEELGFVVEAYYYEPGMMFCGLYEDGCANDIEIGESTYEWASKNIPRAIDEMFGIADEFAQWEAENEAE